MQPADNALDYGSRLSSGPRADVLAVTVLLLFHATDASSFERVTSLPLSACQREHSRWMELGALLRQLCPDGALRLRLGTAGMAKTRPIIRRKACL